MLPPMVRTLAAAGPETGRRPRRAGSLPALATLASVQVLYIAASLYWQRGSDPILWTDEAGYLGIAADLAGRDVAVDLSGSPYYSPGMSLLTAPILAVTDLEPYVAAIGVNVVALLALGALLFTIARQALGATPWTAAAAACVGTTLPSLGINLSRAWAEVLLATLVAAWALALHRFLTARTAPAAALVGVAAMAMWITHHRSIAFVGVTALVLVGTAAHALLERRSQSEASRASLRAVAVSALGLAVLAVGYLAAQRFEQDLAQRLFGGRDALAAGDDLLDKLFTRGFIEKAVGHAWASQVASLGLLGVAVMGVLWGGHRGVRRAWLTALVVAAGGALVVSGSFLARAGRTDTLVYERYFGYVVPTMMAVAVVIIATDQRLRRRLSHLSLICSGILLLALVVLQTRAAFTGQVIAPTTPSIVAWDLIAGDLGPRGFSDLSVGTITVASVLAATLALHLSDWRPFLGVVAVVALFFGLTVAVAHHRFQPFYNTFENASGAAAAILEREGATEFGVMPGLRVESKNSLQYATGYLATVPIDPMVCPDVEFFITPDGVQPGFDATPLEGLPPFGGTLWRTECSP